MAKKTAAKKSTAKKTTAKSATPKKASGKDSISLGGNVWPVERDVLFRPDRLKYVRKLIPHEGCVFCTAAKGEMSLETLCVHRTDHTMVVLNKYPYNSGHLLVLPLKHKGDILGLSEPEFLDLHQVLRLAMRALTDVYQPGGINVGLNHGQAAGAGIPDHLHYHVIPRWAGDLNFFPLIADTKVVVEALDHSFERLQNFFNSHKEAAR